MEAVEAFADGVCKHEEVRHALLAWYRLPTTQPNFNTWQSELNSVANAGEKSRYLTGGIGSECAAATPDPERERSIQATLLRCIFGNPFRPVTFDPRWRTETAVALAAGIYDARAFDRLPILADALEEAGCDQPDVLAHCRQPDGLHARGCWVVDGVLGKA